MIDPTTLTDEELADLTFAVLTERDRRARLAEAAEKLAEAREAIIADGGDPAELDA